MVYQSRKRDYRKSKNDLSLSLFLFFLYSDIIYKKYRSLVTDKTKEKELVKIFSEMVEPFKDSHITISKYTPVHTMVSIIISDEFIGIYIKNQY